VSVQYFDKAHVVKLGDRVSISLFFRRRIGRVVYVPGISAFHPEFEHNGMRWVGIRLEDRTLVATPILSKTQTLKRKVRFAEADRSPCELITADSKEFEEQGEGPAF
jgi:hypothetical protein